MGQKTANIFGFTAVMLWGALAFFTDGTRGIPVFELTALTFGIGGVLLWLLEWAYYRQMPILPNLPGFLLAVGGLFFYHFAYFLAIHGAPPAPISLIAYLWPLFIVIFGAILAKNINIHNILAGFLGFLAVFLIIGQGGVDFDGGLIFYYGLALLCAFIWSGYSLANRLVPQRVGASMSYSCLAVALLALLSHYFLSEILFHQAWQYPEPAQWWYIAGLGLGPVGLAFLCWDIGTKYGNIILLGVLSNGAPLLSTLILIATGKQEFTPTIIISTLLIIGSSLYVRYIENFKAHSSIDS